ILDSTKVACHPLGWETPRPPEKSGGVGAILDHSVRSIPLVLRLGTAPTGIVFTTLIVLLSTTTTASFPAIATYRLLPSGGIVSHSGWLPTGTTFSSPQPGSEYAATYP